MKKLLTILAILVFSPAWLPLPVVAANKDAKTGRDAPTDLIRTQLYVSDYHVEARRVLKTLRSSIERVRSLLAKAQKDNFVVLEDSLQKNVRSLEGLEEVGKDIYAKLSDAVPRVERAPSKAERKAGDEYLRQMNVIKDRAIALFVSSRSFSNKLLRKIQTTVKRIDDR